MQIGVVFPSDIVHLAIGKLVDAGIEYTIGNIEDMFMCGEARIMVDENRADETRKIRAEVCK